MTSFNLHNSKTSISKTKDIPERKRALFCKAFQISLNCFFFHIRFKSNYFNKQILRINVTRYIHFEHGIYLRVTPLKHKTFRISIRNDMRNLYENIFFEQGMFLKVTTMMKKLGRINIKNNMRRPIVKFNILSVGCTLLKCR